MIWFNITVGNEPGKEFGDYFPEGGGACTIGVAGNPVWNLMLTAYQLHFGFKHGPGQLIFGHVEWKGTVWVISLVVQVFDCFKIGFKIYPDG